MFLNDITLSKRLRRPILNFNLKEDEEMVCVHVIDGDSDGKQQVPVPDMRANKPLGVHDQQANQTGFFQKLIHTKIGQLQIGIAAPNEISLSLSISNKSLKNATALRNLIKEIGTTSEHHLFDENVNIAYDFLEEIQKAIVFAYKAVESFCNASIPDNYIHENRNSRGVVELYGKEQIERWINTSEKVSSILPKILQVSSPIPEHFWSNFKNLERLRNEIIHSKSSTSSEILSELFSDKVDEYLRSCFLLLEFFMKKDPCNQIFPLGFGTSQIKVISIPDSEQLLLKIN